MLSKSTAILLTGLILASSFVHSEDRFPLPASKAVIVHCQNEVLAKHNGEIANQKIIHLPAGQLEIHFEIHDQDSEDWLVICDGVSGKILQDIKLDDYR